LNAPGVHTNRQATTPVESSGPAPRVIGSALLLVVVVMLAVAACSSRSQTSPSQSPSLEGGVWLGSYNGVVVHALGADAAWNRQPSQAARGNALPATAFADSLHGWAVGDGGTVIHTSDGGRTWSAQDSSVDVGLEGVAFADEHTGFAVGDSGTFLATTDGGSSWTAQSAPSDLPTQTRVYAVATLDGRSAWAVDDSGGVELTIDGGTIWRREQVASRTSPLFDVTFADDSHGWVAGDGGILATTDGGRSWTHQALNPTLSAVTFADRTQGWAVGGEILRTTDGGANWQDVTPRRLVDREVLLFGIAAQDASHVWAVGSRTLSLGHSRGVILYSADSGQTWTEVAKSATGGVPAWASAAAVGSAGP
jgi:photosystem II stability/assembly factor-like uncharacterized protein